jgi:hypothetical protein
MSKYDKAVTRILEEVEIEVGTAGKAIVGRVDHLPGYREIPTFSDPIADQARMGHTSVSRFHNAVEELLLSLVDMSQYSSPHDIKNMVHDILDNLPGRIDQSEEDSCGCSG